MFFFWRILPMKNAHSSYTSHRTAAGNISEISAFFCALSRGWSSSGFYEVWEINIITAWWWRIGMMLKFISQILLRKNKDLSLALLISTKKQATAFSIFLFGFVGGLFLFCFWVCLFVCFSAQIRIPLTSSDAFKALNLPDTQYPIGTATIKFSL